MTSPSNRSHRDADRAGEASAAAATPPRVLRVLLALCVLAASLLIVAPVGLPRAAAQAPLAVRTQDGFQLGISADGGVESVSVGGRALPRTASGGGFSMRMVGQNPNLLANGGLEEDADADGVPDGWRLSTGATAPELDPTVAHGGGRSIKLSNPALATSGGLTAEVAVRPSTNYFVTAWFKSENVLPTAATTGNPNVGRPDGSPLHVRVEQLAGTTVVGTHYAFGYTDTADWNKQAIGFRTDPRATGVRVTGLLRNGSGAAWLDDVSLEQLLQDASIPLRGSVSPLTDGSGALGQHAEAPSQQLAFDAKYTPAPDHLRIDASVTDTALVNSPRTDKAFQITYTLPVDAVGWRWGDHARKSRPIGANAEYSYGVRQTIQPARYPYAVVYDAQTALSVGTPLGVPRLARTSYDSRTGLSITFDLGVSEAATKLGTRADFSILLYASDPSWGFRAATKKYYELNPSSFVRRTDPAREGIWYNRPNLSTLDRPATTEDESRAWGLGLQMIAMGMDANQSHSTWGTEYLPWDNERGVYASAYNHHWGFFQPRCPQGAAGCELPTYEQAIARLRADAAITPATPEEARLRDEAMGALNSSSRDLNGRLRYNNYDASYIKWWQNPDPDFSAGMDWVTAVQKYQVQGAIDLAQGATARLDGIHLDSTSGQDRWADDYSRAHWAVANMPLSFSYDDGQVTERLIFAMYEQLRRVSRFAHERGMILSVNFNANEWTPAGWVGADQIDYFGLEQGLPERAAAGRGVSVDSFALLKRTLAYQRPVSTLDGKIGDGSLTLAQIEGRIQQNLFYGIFPGARGAFWATAGRRAIYARYTPHFKTLAAAGWEPVTNARSSNPTVWLERFGAVSGGNLYLTVRNETAAAQEYTLAVDLDKDGGKAAQGASATELLGGGPLPTSLSPTGAQAVVSGSIAAGSTQLVRLSVTSDVTAPTGKVSINGGVPYTALPKVGLDVSAGDPDDGNRLMPERVSEVRVSSSPAVSEGLLLSGATLPYSPSITWDLSDPATGGTAGDGERAVWVQWRDRAGNWSAPQQDAIVLDSGAPIVAPPAQGVLVPGGLGRDAVPVRFSWSASDATSGVETHELQLSRDGGAWAPAGESAIARMDVELRPGGTYRARARARDRAGNVSPWVQGPRLRLEVRDDGDAAVRYAGKWRPYALDAFHGGRVAYSGVSGSKATLTFAGSQVAWVSTRKHNRGRAEVWLDGKKAAVVDLYGRAWAPRQLVYVARGLDPARRHTLEVRVLGTKGQSSNGARVDVDAFIVLR